MGLIAKERFVTLMAEAPVLSTNRDNYHALNNTLRGQIASAIGIQLGEHNNPAWARNADRESALACYEQIKKYIMDEGWLRGKLLRPWSIDNQLYRDLDRREAWFGFEFETGWVSAKARAQAIAYVWDNFDGVCFDAEGEGNVCVEITFGPQEESKFDDGTAQAVRFIDYLDANPGLTNVTGNSAIGTHLNISHPGLTVENVAKINRMMNRSVAAIPTMLDGVGNVRQLMFGRASLYGGFFAQNQAGSVWLEGKLYRTTYTRAAFDRYLKSAKALSKALSVLIAINENADFAWQRELDASPYVANLYDVAFGDAEPEVRWSKISSDAKADINGKYGSDTFTDKHPQTQKEVEDELIKIREAKRLEEERKAKQAELEAAYEKLRADRKKLFLAGKSPKDLPKGYAWCEDCEDYHDDNGDSVYFIHEQQVA